MISLPIRSPGGQQVGTYEFDPDELAPRINRQLLHDVVVMYEANRRQGTVQTKSRGMVKGSTKKLYRQKGTGRARAGNRRTPVRVGGGHTFGKKPRDWSYRLPKKAIRLATRMALLSKFLDNQVTVLDDLPVSEPKTKHVATVLKALGLSESTCLLAIETHDANLWKSVRNIANLWVSPARELNAYHLLHQRQLIVTRAALDALRRGAGDGGRPTDDE
ncbi:MAG TPA: 50S ribosomal protein L4 [Planctomycetaceae bacterium]|nr:50S ribosomal protein L4 [Planctomycetaceae bacterium]